MCVKNLDTKEAYVNLSHIQWSHCNEFSLKDTRITTMVITQNYGLRHWSNLENWQGKMQRSARYLNIRQLQGCATVTLDKKQPIIAYISGTKPIVINSFPLHYRRIINVLKMSSFGKH